MVSPSSTLPVRWTGIPGTWGAKDYHDWWTKDAPFAAYLRDRLGIYPLCPNNPFYWSTDLELLPFSILSTSKHSDWKAAGAAISYYLRDVPIPERNLIAHSHGLQAVLYACAEFGVKLNTLTSVSSPVRKDMMEVAEKARPNIGYWTHVHSDGSDRTQWLGTLFDGAFGIIRKHPLADLNVKIPKVGHSDLLRKSQHFHHWDSLLYPLTQNYGKSSNPSGRGPSSD